MHIPTVVLLGVAMALCLQVAEAEDKSYEDKGTIEEGWNVFYDIIVESTATGDIELEVLVDDLENDIDLHAVSLSGGLAQAAYYDEYDATELWWEVHSYGAYTVVLTGDDIEGVCEFTVECNYPIERSAYVIEGTLREGENVSYDFDVQRTDKPLVIYLSWFEHPDNMYLRVYDSQDVMVEHTRYDYEGDHVEYFYDIEETGSYTAVVHATTVESGDSLDYRLESNVKIPPGEAFGGPKSLMSEAGTTIVIVVVVLLIIIVALFLVVRMRRSRATATTQAAYQGMPQQYPQQQQYAQQPQQYAQPQQQPPQQQPPQQQPPQQPPPQQQQTQQYAQPQQPVQQQPVQQPHQSPGQHPKAFCDRCGSPLGQDGRCPRCAPPG